MVIIDIHIVYIRRYPELNYFDYFVDKNYDCFV